MKVLVHFTIILIYMFLKEVTSKSFPLYPKDSPTEACILLDIDFTINIKLLDTDSGSVVNSNALSQDDVEKVQGSCGRSGTSTLFLRFQNGTSFELIFTHKDDNVYLKRLVQFNPTQMFGPIEDINKFVTFTSPSVDILPNDGFSYACSRTQKFAYTYDQGDTSNYTIIVESEESDIKTQAFKLQKNEFGPVFTCGADTQSTKVTSPIPISTTIANFTTPGNESSPTPSLTPNATTPSLTPNATTPLPPIPPVNNYTVNDDDITCIALSAAISFSIDYPTNLDPESKTSTKKFQIPTNAIPMGACGSSQEELSIRFMKDWSLNFIFNTGDKLESTFGEKKRLPAYSISNISLTYVLEDEYFPELAPFVNGLVLTAKSDSSDMFPSKAAGSSYYRCSTPVSLSLNQNVTMTIRSLEFKAFNQDNSTGFEGQANTCYSDTETDHTIPIVAGSCVGAVFLLGIILVVIKQFRRRAKINRYKTILSK